MRLSQDNTSYRASNIERRDFRHAANGPEVTGQKRKKKDTKKWCRGVEGREHKLILGKQNFWRDDECGDKGHDFLGSTWICHHTIKCAECDKILDEFLGTRCPDYQ